MVDKKFDCCESRTCKQGVTNAQIFSFDFEAQPYHTVVFSTFGKGVAYTVTIDQSNSQDYKHPQTTTINQGATGTTNTIVPIIARYMRVRVTITGIATYKVCRMLTECCAVDYEALQAVLAMLQQILAEISASTDSYYQDQGMTAMTAAFVEQTYGFTSRYFVLSNDEDPTISVKTLQWSWDGVAVAGTLNPGETWKEPIAHDSIYLKGSAGGESYRVWAW